MPHDKGSLRSKRQTQLCCLGLPGSGLLQWQAVAAAWPTMRRFNKKLQAATLQPSSQVCPFAGNMLASVAQETLWALQVCWVDYKGWWISAANDDTLRCWASMGDCLLEIPCSGARRQESSKKPYMPHSLQ